jgi:hypothetical protein
MHTRYIAGAVRATLLSFLSRVATSSTVLTIILDLCQIESWENARFNPTTPLLYGTSTAPLWTPVFAFNKVLLTTGRLPLYGVRSTEYTTILS